MNVSAENIIIYVYSTYIKFKVNKDGMAHPNFYVQRFVEKYLTELDYNKKLKKFSVLCRYVYYDEANEMFHIPYNTLPLLLHNLQLCNIGYTLIECSPIKSYLLHAKMKKKIVDREERQVEIMNYLIHSTRKSDYCELQTGIGKTYCAIKNAVLRNKRFLVQTSGVLLEQWMKSIINFTTIKRDDIYIIQGFDTLQYLLSTPLKPKVIIFSSDTLKAYVEKKDLYSSILDYNSFLIKYGIGIRNIDECHEKFHMNTIIDLHSNVEKNVYLSASFIRGSFTSNKIFDILFPIKDRFTVEYKKYIEIKILKHSIGTAWDFRKVKTHKGYNHFKYEMKLLKDVHLYNEWYKKVIQYSIETFFIPNRKENQKMLIICGMVDMCYKLKKDLTLDYPQFNIKTYVKIDKVNNLNADIIVGVLKKCGTGTDIKNLLVVLKTIASGSPVQSYQNPGRLRELSENDIAPIFIDICNIVIPKHITYLHYKKPIYRKISNKIEEIYV